MLGYSTPPPKRSIIAAIPFKARLCLTVLAVLLVPLACSFLDELSFTTERNWAGLDQAAIVWRHRHAYDVQFYTMSRPTGGSFAGFAVQRVPTTRGDNNAPDSFRLFIVPLWPLLLILAGYPAVTIWVVIKRQRED